MIDREHLELARFLRAAQGDRYRGLFVIAAATGLRQGELLGLAWDDVDLDAATAHVGLQLQRRDGEYVRVPRKGQGKAYDIDLPAIAVDELRRIRETQPRAIDGGLVFTTEQGRPVNASVPTHRLHRIAAAAGLRPMDFHGLRRLRATMGAQLGIDPTVTQAALGHANVTTTLGIYTYSDRVQTRSAAGQVDAMLRKAIG